MAYALTLTNMDIVEKALAMYEKWFGIIKEQGSPPQELLSSAYLDMILQISLVFENEEVIYHNNKLFLRVLSDYMTLLKPDSPLTESNKTIVVYLLILLTQYILEHYQFAKTIKVSELLNKSIGAITMLEDISEDVFAYFEKLLMCCYRIYDKECIVLYLQWLEEITLYLIHAIENNEVVMAKMSSKHEFFKKTKYSSETIFYLWVQFTFVIIKNKSAFKEEAYDMFIEALCNKIILPISKASFHSKSQNLYPTSGTMLKLFGITLQQLVEPFIYKNDENIAATSPQKLSSINSLIYTTICFNGEPNKYYLATIQLLIFRCLKGGHINTIISAIKSYFKTNSNNAGILIAQLLSSYKTESISHKGREHALYIVLLISYYLHNLQTGKEQVKLLLAKVCCGIMKLYLSDSQEKGVKEYIIVFWY